ncbi:MAG: MCP four helix bundle domain-containing protein [Curvibacter sp.]|nr:MCP four helix bundle domain-containing protein [Curvibacter sp.]
MRSAHSVRLGRPSLALRDMSIANRLRLTLGFVLAMLLLQSLASLWGVEQALTLVQGKVAQARQRHDLANAVRDAGKSEELYLRRLSVQVEPDKVEREIASALQAGREADQALAALAALPLDVADRSAVEALRRSIQGGRAMRDRVIDLGRQLQTDAVNQVFELELDPLIQKSQAATAAWVAQQKEAEGAAFDDIVSLSRRSRVLIVGTALFGVLIGVSAGLALYRSVTRPLNATAERLDCLATGDLTLEIQAEARGETGRMMAAMGQMVGRLREAVGTVVSSSRSILDSSTEIAAGNQDLSLRTERQAAALQQATRSLELIARGVQENAEASREAQAQAQAASEQATLGGQQVRQIVQTMEAVSSSSRRMSEIIGVIDGIAFQTNILALNAAVEAARAGEQGRGFAVVATEVRTLAQRSAQAAREIKALIQTNVETVDLGASQVSEAGGTIGAVEQSSAATAHWITRISESCQQQAREVAQVHQAVSEVDDGLQRNAALVEQATAAASSLRGQAEALGRVLAYFKVERETGPR